MSHPCCCEGDTIISGVSGQIGGLPLSGSGDRAFCCHHNWGRWCPAGGIGEGDPLQTTLQLGMTVSITGIIDGNCTECDDLNASYDLNCEPCSSLIVPVDKLNGCCYCRLISFPGEGIGWSLPIDFSRYIDEEPCEGCCEDLGDCANPCSGWGMVCCSISANSNNLSEFWVAVELTSNSTLCSVEPIGHPAANFHRQCFIWQRIIDVSPRECLRASDLAITLTGSELTAGDTGAVTDCFYCDAEEDATATITPILCPYEVPSLL